jgi:hypothetical protein
LNEVETRDQSTRGMQIKKGRCLIPASHFFEFTGTKPPKSKWRFTKAGEDWFCFAGLWRPMPDAGGDAFTLPAALLEAARSLRPARSRLATTQRTQPNSSRKGSSRPSRQERSGPSINGQVGVERRHGGTRRNGSAVRIRLAAGGRGIRTLGLLPRIQRFCGSCALGCSLSAPL